MAWVAVQTWVRPGTTIAGGDVVVPNGTAWIGRLFEPWTWGGSTLGEPTQLSVSLPWAVVVGLVHAFGGDIGTAQRIWYTALFVGAGLAALGLLAALRMGPVAALAGTFVYLFNPYVITWVNTYDNYLAALVVFAAIPAALVAAGTGRLSTRWSAALIAATAPLIGYAFLNPPLVGMIVVAILATPLLVAWVEGKDAAMRSLRALLLAIPLLLAVSAYWVVPAILHFSSVIPAQLANLADWTWAEGRATIRNAFWLNTHWGWNSTEYFPYARAYNAWPISMARFLLPAIAFGALGLVQFARGEWRFRRNGQLRLAVAAATVALIIIVFSTGTNPPGNVFFLALYNAPLGWLLREPGRFLMLVALAYAALTGVLVDALLNGLTMPALSRLRWPTLAASRLAIAPLALGTSILLGFPMYTGAFVSDAQPTLPSWAIHARPTHVQMPAYWPEMAHITDALPVQGAVLVMPPDGFYEMPYTWYYGSDGFIAQLFQRRVLVPAPQGYTPAHPQLIDAVNLTAQSVIHRDWPETQALVTALNAPIVLVRRDIESPYAGRSIISPNELADALRSAPNFELVRQVGPLDLFVLRQPLMETQVSTDFAMTNSLTPDLSLLSVVPPNTALVSGKPKAGAANVVQAPPLEQWKADGDVIVWQQTAPPGWKYSIADVLSKTVIHLDKPGTFTVGPSKATATYSSSSSGNAVQVSLSGRTTIKNGDFAQGLWGPVGDCHAVDPVRAKSVLRASVTSAGAPGGLPVLQLSTSLDSACESQGLSWHGGPLLLRALIHPVQGPDPRICVWEVGPGKCAALPAITHRSGWSEYRALVVPDPGTTSVQMYLYADASAQGSPTVSEYAGIRALELPALPKFALVGEPAPNVVPNVRLALTHSTYSNDWQSSIGGDHVIVDGMLNGWLVPSGSSGFSAQYSSAFAFRASGYLSLAALLLVILMLFAPRIGTVVRVQLGKRFPGAGDLTRAPIDPSGVSQLINGATVAIGIPAFNEGDGVIPTLRSLWVGLSDLHLTDARVILIDSFDNASLSSAEPATRWANEVGANIEVESVSRRRSKKEALNAVFERAKSDVLVLVDADVLVPSQSLKTLLYQLFTMPRPVAVIGSTLPDPTYSRMNYRGGAWQLRAVTRAALMAPRSITAAAFRVEGAFWGAWRSFYATYRIPIESGSIHEDVEVMRALVAGGYSSRNVAEAFVYKVPPGSLHDLCFGTVRGEVALGKRTRASREYVAGAIETTRDPLGAILYGYAMIWCRVNRSRLTPYASEKWRILETTKRGTNPTSSSD